MLVLSFGEEFIKPKEFTWKKYGYAVYEECDIPLNALMKLDLCQRPILYDLFVESSSDLLLPVPVRILNTIRSARRPNVNVKEDGSDTDDDFLVRRFFLCDAAMTTSGGGDGSAYLQKATPRFIRWAAHMFMEFRRRDNTDASELYVPVLNIMYLDASTTYSELSPPPLRTTFKAE